MYDVWDRQELLFKIKLLQDRVDAFESGRKYSVMVKEHKIARESDFRVMERLRKDLAQERAEKIRIRNLWFGTCEDILKECGRTIARKEKEYEREKHLGMTIDGWVVELHGRLYCGLSSRIERELDDIYVDTFNGGNVRTWNNNGVQVFQLGIENDVFYVFTHILQHFYKEGVGLRQICDWCRLMWTYRDKIDVQKLKSRLKRAGIMSEWKAFYNLASKYLGMPNLVNGFGIMVHDSRYDKKADRIMEFVLKAGNMGHNRDMSHFSKYPYLIRKCVSMGRRIGDLINHARIFPLDSLRFFPRIMWNGVKSAVRGE